MESLLSRIPIVPRWAAICGLGLVLAVQGARAAEKRVALLVGNVTYQHAGVLKNCVNDARGIGASLESLGFVTRTVADADRKTMEAALDWLRENVQDADLGLFFYSGHGIQVGGVNYLVPIDARVEVEGQVKYQAINANYVADDLAKSGCRTSVLILDACRDNPFSRGWRGTGTRGLAAMEAHPESYVAFAADAGQVASDNPGEENGLYTSELLKHLKVPGLAIEEVFKRTRQGVWTRSNKKQLPAEYSRLMRNVVLAPGEPAAAPGEVERPAVNAVVNPPPVRPPAENAPVVPAPARERATDEEVTDFLVRFLRDFHGPNVNLARPYYAEKVDYLEHGPRDWSFIRKDLEQLNRGYPRRAYALVDVSRIERSGPFTSVSFRFRFDVSNDSRRIRGTAECDVTLVGFAAYELRISRYKEGNIQRTVDRR